MMKLSYPAYYKQFSCIAAACPDSCCKEWIVDVDPESAALYRVLPGDLGDRLRAVLTDTDTGTVMEIEDGRCPMWRQDGLCRIQAELGHDALCKTCREFPRLRHDYGSFAELDLELSCPEAAMLILTAEDTLCQEEADGGDAPDYDPAAMGILLRSRQVALELLEDARYSPAQALAILMLYAHDVQEALDGWEPLPYDPDTLLADAGKYTAARDPGAVLAFFRGLEILTDRWAALLDNAPRTVLLNDNVRPLARYFIRRYWLQAISDLDLVCRVKFLVAACLVISAPVDDFIGTAQLFSKEIENNTDNVEAILDGAYAAPALTDQNLLSILLG